MYRYIKLALLTGCLTSAQAYSAPLQNGDFATGSLAPWSDVGNASVQSLEVGPSGQPFQALIGNAGVLGYALGSNPATGVAALNGALGLSAGALDTLKIAGDTGNVVIGSAIQQSFTASAGSQLSFNWNFLSDETSNHAGNDFAFVLIDGSLQRIANTFSASGPTPTVFTNETGYHTFSTVLSTGGAHTVAFGVVDVTDGLGASAVLIDNVRVAAVPEPGSFALMLAGLVMAAGVIRTRTRGL